MNRSWQCIGAMIVWAAWGAAAQGQFAPPDAGSSAASPTGGGGGMSVSPPPAVADPVIRGGGPLAEVRANQTMTASGMIGYVSAEPVFLTEVFQPIDADLRRLADTSGTMRAFREAAATLIGNQLSHLVSDRMVVAAAELQLTDQNRASIEVFLAQLRHGLISDHGGSIPAAERAFAASKKPTLDQQMAEKRRQVIKELYFQKSLVPRIIVTRQMLVDAYEKDPKRWQQVAQVELYTITLPISNWLREPTSNGVRGAIIARPTAQQIADAEAQALAQGREIAGKLKAGADFARLVEDYDSRDSARGFGGRRGMINRGAMVNTKLEDYVFSLKADSLGEPQLLRETGFENTTVVVAKIGKKTEARTIPFSEAQSQLAEELRTAQFIELRTQEMERLARSATIEAVDRMRDVALDAAVTRYLFK